MSDSNIKNTPSELFIPMLLGQNKFQLPSKPLLHTPLTPTHIYYRSKFLTATQGINPLLKSANTLISFIANFQNFSMYSDNFKLHQYLTHEIKVFEVMARDNYRQEVLLVTRYILCCVLDEIVLKHISPTMQKQWRQHTLLASFHNEEQGDERFFLILDYLISDASSHIDLLELIYLCLRLGYQGKYQFVENSKKERNEVIEALYEMIDYQRGDNKKKISLLYCDSSISNTKTKRWLTYKSLAIGATILILSWYALFNFLLSDYIVLLYRQLNSI